ncbi:hypothetical protein GP486_004729 [Trichoglossum hirsutum]|uniref:DUF7779 domain-containing protein n=1 Tax=Trichoglossum hirsutum TaxID=265104 RepID=A0A9P8LAR2_9PEZI|nr:hypothetical protein GP486_004729 [Trichoglossum hirsutum]
MRRGIRNLFRRKPNKNAGQAEAIEDAYDATDEPLDNAQFGLDVLVEGVNPVVDIVAIHGLNGDPEKTWIAKNSVNWLRDPNMLAAVIPNARIMSWGYDANTHSTKELSAMYLYGHAQKLVSDLGLLRRMDKALIYSDSTRSKHLYHHKSIKTSTYGIMFMGTPHQGGEGVAWGRRLVSVASIFVKTNNNLLNVLERDSEALLQQLDQYAPISGDFETKFAFETKATPLALGNAIIVVPKASAVLPGQLDAEPIAIMEDHINMVKFSSQNNTEFKRVAGHLKLMAEKAPAKVRENWLTEGSVEAARIGNSKLDFGVPFDLKGIPMTNAFIGRKSDLNLMKEQLKPGELLDRRKICVLYGLGGMGKTQLAVEYARLHKDLYASFFWLDGKTEVSLIQSLLLIASRLPKGQIPDIDIQDVKELDESKKGAQEVLKWFALKGNTQWLLIFDNIDETSYEEVPSQSTTSSSYDITQYFPGGDTGSIIITTRLQRLASLGSHVHLRKASISDSLLILEKHARRSLKRSASVEEPEIDQWDPDAVSLVERLGCLPLALVFAGSYISKTTIVKYLELYNKSWVALHGEMKNRSDYPERTIVTTWQISFEALKLKDEGASKLLQLWGYLDNQELWFQLLKWPGYESVAPGWLRKITASEIAFLATVDTLLDYSLIEQNDKSETYTMHTVVHDWIRASVNEKGDESLLQIAVITIGLAVPDREVRDSATLQRRLLPHAIQCSQLWGQVSDFQQHLDQDAYLASFNNLGILYRSQGKLTEAEAMLQRALAGYEKALGPEHTSTLNTVNNLVALYRNQGKLTEVVAMVQRALARKEKVLALDQPPHHHL